MTMQALPDVAYVDAELSKQSLRHFMTQAWHVIEPGKSFVPGFHIDAICDHMQALIAGDIRKLVINVPPRTSKSTTVAVMAPVWSWIGNPHRQWLLSSYAQTLSTRDALKSRRLIQSAWFNEQQKLWGTDIRLTLDQNQKQRYENTVNGYRIAASVEGTATGEGGDYVGVDDPHNVIEGESDKKRMGALTWWDETMSSRLNDAKTGCMFIIMQRVHEADLAGHALEDLGYEHLNLPMRYEGKCVVEMPHQCSQMLGTSLGFRDPRTKQGALLCEDRMGETEVDDLESTLGPYAFAGQYEQRPAPREGGMIQMECVEIVPDIPKGLTLLAVGRGWDKAATEGAGCNTAGTKIGLLSDGRWIFLDCVAGQWGTDKRELKMREVAEQDGANVRIYIEQEPGSGGKDSAKTSVKTLAGFHVKIVAVTGSKESRAYPMSVQTNIGNFLMLAGKWNKAFIKEYNGFPNAKFKDRVDAGTVAFNEMSLRNFSWSTLYKDQ